MSRSILYCALILAFGLSEASAQKAKADAASKLLITLCVGGGSITITKSTTSEDKYRVGGSDDSVLVERKEIIGLVDGINSAMDNLSAAQANKVRECMKPYIGRLMDLVLDEQDDDTKVKRVTGNVEWNEAPSSSKYDWNAEFSYIYKNFGRSKASCRFVAVGVLRRKSDRTIYKRFEQSVDDFSLVPKATHEVTGVVGISGFSDDKYVVSIESNVDCW